MQFIKDRFNYLFTSTKGLILVAIAMVAIVTAVWGMLSGPMAEFGVRDVVVKLLHMDLQPSEREGRIVILYHSIAMAIIAIETYMVTGLLRMKPFFKTTINAIITVGYLVTMVFGMGFRILRPQLGIPRTVHLWPFPDLLRRGIAGHRAMALESRVLRH